MHSRHNWVKGTKKQAGVHHAGNQEPDSNNILPTAHCRSVGQYETTWFRPHYVIMSVYALPCSLFKVCLKNGETAVQWACKLSIFRGCSNCPETAGIRLHSNYSAGTNSAGTHLFIFVLHTRSLLSLSLRAFLMHIHTVLNLKIPLV